MRHAVLTICTICLLLAVALPAEDAPAPAKPTATTAPPRKPPKHRDGPRHGRPPKNGGLPPNLRRYFQQLREENPAEYERLQRLRTENREAFMAELARRFPNPDRDFMERVRENERQCWEIVRQLRTTPPPTNAKELQEQLTTLVNASYELLVEHSQMRLEALQKRLKEIQGNRETIVKQRLQFYLNATPPPPRKESPKARPLPDGPKTLRHVAQ